MDTLQTIIFLILIAVAAAVFIIWTREIAWDFFSVRKTGEVRAAMMKDVVLIVLLFPVFLAGIIGSVWLYYRGWQGFASATLTTGAAALGMGGFMALVYYAANVTGRRIAAKKKIE